MATYVEIANVTVGSGGASSISFSSIPSTYTDLAISLTARTNVSSTQTYVKLKMNSTDYASGRNLFAVVGYAVSSDTSALFMVPGATQSSNVFSSNTIYIPNYTSSNQKSASHDTVTEGTVSASVWAQLLATLTNVTSAVTSLEIYTTDSSNFVQYSTAYLYGIKKD